MSELDCPRLQNPEISSYQMSFVGSIVHQLQSRGMKNRLVGSLYVLRSVKKTKGDGMGSDYWRKAKECGSVDANHIFSYNGGDGYCRLEGRKPLVRTSVVQHGIWGIKISMEFDRLLFFLVAVPNEAHNAAEMRYGEI
jgi:hypothetical protein